MSADLLEALAALTTHILNGKVPATICPFLYGASLTAFIKKDGGIRSIAVGCTLRRLAGKVVSRVMAEMGAQLRPEQVGCGTRGSAEAAVHASRLFLSRINAECQVVLKLDFKNAFSTVFRGRLLAEVKKALPVYFNFVSHMYSQLSILVYGDQVLQSARGVQQGDPLGPLLFCLVTEKLSKSRKSDFSCWYLDDATVGGDVDRVIVDFQRVVHHCEVLGLELSMDKCEIFVFGGSRKEQLTTKSLAKAIFPTVTTLTTLRAFQHTWDLPIVEKNFSEVLQASSSTEKARMLTVSTKESGAWLNSLPASCLGNLLDDDSLRISLVSRPTVLSVLRLRACSKKSGRELRITREKEDPLNFSDSVLVWTYRGEMLPVFWEPFHSLAV
ncbi:hypothetical protein RvY_00219 [Ramazzottius varieornatus]|uniref:Reverse transcriptase domain-containing protein n=1 Tax=Ramazzottius varieornatus TaxID=947166 RepID=A0A1D1ULY2_RAMVA|nr:hypothetical protein RvY_00219 [Ramazzottius varieornatus]